MVQAKVWILTKHFEGFPQDSNFELKVEQLPEPKDGGRQMYCLFISFFSLFIFFSLFVQCLEKLMKNLKGTCYATRCECDQPL